MAEPVLALDRLNKSFGALHVTRDVCLDIRPGEVHALIGPNGAGKTTLVSQIAGSLKPDSGRIRFAGEDVTRLGVAPRARRGLARVFQISNVVGAFTALENVAVAVLAASGGAFGMGRPALADPALRAKAQDVLDSVGLAGRMAVRAVEFSHGERRALELAMSLVQDPELLLLDEPMAGTGRAEGEKLTRLLLSLKGRIPMLLIEHDMTAVFTLADRVSVLIGGAVAATGEPAVIRSDPVVRKAYIGEDEAV
ncbi:ABC transporter ATP-binding protein [Xanthobacter autotrophicus]|uniref:ABC transporter ATP-binding protein n=1 Tax=Xanthobacter TaxID=279 RepID=UPI0024AA9956|nr:ABC transporter ATP-binding protein [Xanthobacter autotrophicus]MDI4664812.1 ABC transporter ATP-binding protein [Xanthobacter autotrophicus]